MPRFSSQQCSGAAANSGLPFQRQNRTCSTTMPPSTTAMPMPLMLLFWFNNYSSGLSYYYLVSNIITIGQTYAFRYIVNEDKLHHRMKENAKKPRKLSKFQQRYEEMMRQREQMARKR